MLSMEDFDLWFFVTHGGEFRFLGERCLVKQKYSLSVKAITKLGFHQNHISFEDFSGLLENAIQPARAV